MYVIDEGTLVELAEAAYTDPVLFGKTVVNRYDWVPFQNSGVEGFIATVNRTAIVVFRGTEVKSHIDVLMDVRFLFPRKHYFGGKVHRGFCHAFRRVRDDVFSKLTKSCCLTDPEQIVFAGHSAGGALANLAAAHASVLGFENIHLVTFGAPRVGDEQWAKRLFRRVSSCYRFVNGADLVPFVPPANVLLLPKYRHVGTSMFITELDRFIDNPSCSDIVVEIWRRVLGKRTAFMADHSVAAYRKHVEDWLHHRWRNQLQPLIRIET